MAYDELKVAAPEYMSADVVAAKAPDATQQFGSSSLNPAMQAQLKQILQPADPIKAAAEGPKEKLPPIRGEPTGEERVSRAGDAVRHQGGGSWLSDAVNMGLQAMERTPEVKQGLENVPEAPENDGLAVAAPNPEPEAPVNHYNRDLTMPTPGMNMR